MITELQFVASIFTFSYFFYKNTVYSYIFLFSRCRHLWGPNRPSHGDSSLLTCHQGSCPPSHSVSLPTPTPSPPASPASCKPASTCLGRWRAQGSGRPRRRVPTPRRPQRRRTPSTTETRVQTASRRCASRPSSTAGSPGYPRDSGMQPSPLGNLLPCQPVSTRWVTVRGWSSTHGWWVRHVSTKKRRNGFNSAHAWKWHAVGQGRCDWLASSSSRPRRQNWTLFPESDTADTQLSSLFSRWCHTKNCDTIMLNRRQCWSSWTEGARSHAPLPLTLVGSQFVVVAPCIYFILWTPLCWEGRPL